MREVDVSEYVSIVVNRDSFNTIEYFICAPFSGQRLRGTARPGQTVVFRQQNLTNVVEKLGKNSFRCIVKADELPKSFQKSQEFVVARGRFQQFLKVAEGSRLSKLEPMSDTEMASNAIKDVREMAEQDLIGSRKTPFYEMFTRFAQQKVTSSDQEDTIENLHTRNNYEDIFDVLKSNLNKNEQLNDIDGRNNQKSDKMTEVDQTDKMHLTELEVKQKV